MKERLEVLLKAYLNIFYHVSFLIFKERALKNASNLNASYSFLTSRIAHKIKSVLLYNKKSRKPRDARRRLDPSTIIILATTMNPVHLRGNQACNDPLLLNTIS